MILDGSRLKDKILEESKLKIENNNLDITLAIILVGNDEASKIYINAKQKACEEVGIKVALFELNEQTTEDTIIDLIDKLNKDDEIIGIILQSPIPDGLDYNKCISYIDSKKDVDGFTKDNIYNLYLNKECILPCTVKGIIRLLKEYDVSIDGANVVIVGRGNIVGKPLGLALLNENASVTWTHSKTKDLAFFTKNADIVISAVGKAHIIRDDMVKDGAVVIDVGISKQDGHIIGDVDFDMVKNKVSFISPNPKGVGPMTVAMIIDNLIEMKLKEK